MLEMIAATVAGAKRAKTGFWERVSGEGFE